MGSSQWENGREEFEDKYHVRVLQQCLPELVDNLNVSLVLDYMGSKGIIHHVTIRDIREQTTTSDKTRKLVQYLMEGDEQSYHKFKECLKESGQPDLKNILEDVERKVGAKDPICIDLTKDEDLDNFVDLTCSQGVDDASVIVVSSLESDDASTSWDRSSNAKTNSVLQMKSNKRPVNTISSLSKGRTEWRIRAHVTQKSNIRTWSNSRGEGKLFSVNLVDESGEIRAIGFTDAVDKFFNLLEVNKVISVYS